MDTSLEVQIYSSSNLQDNVTIHEPYVLTVEDWIAFIGLWLAAVFTVGGNTLVILSFIRDRKLREKPSNLFLLGLAVTDLLTGLVSLPLDNMWRLNYDWPYGRTVCVFWTFLDYTVTVQSAYIISLISADRYFLLSKGLHYQFFQTRRRVIIQLVVTFLISFVFHLCAIVWYDDTNHVDFDEECELNGLGALSYVILALILEFILPLLTVCFFNLAIYIRIQRRVSRPVEKASTNITLASSAKPLMKSNMNVHLNVNQQSTSDTVSTLETFELDDSGVPSKCDVEAPADFPNNSNKVPSEKRGSRRPHKKVNARRSSKKAAKTLSILTIVFIVCWLPYNVATIIRNISSDLINVRTWDMVNYLLWLNSAVNPVLYAATNLQFRRNFRELLGKLLKPFDRLPCVT